jgi:hypothetical protein
MSSEEAKQLLDSAKSDEKHGAPSADQDGYHPPPDKPYRNW